MVQIVGVLDVRVGVRDVPFVAREDAPVATV
jgi:hypothetical protein